MQGLHLDSELDLKEEMEMVTPAVSKMCKMHKVDRSKYIIVSIKSFNSLEQVDLSATVTTRRND